MKRLIMVATLAATLLLSAAFAHAVEITVQGSFEFNFGFYSNYNLYNSNQTAKKASALNNSGPILGGRTVNDSGFDAVQRVRTQINFIASENVQGVLFFEIGELNWGNGNGSFATAAGGSRVGVAGGGAIGTDGVNIKTRRAYIDFNVPNTELMFRVGLQGLDLPAAVAGSPILGSSGTDMAAILGVYKINDIVSVAAFWARPWNTNVGTEAVHAYDEMDLFGMLVPVTLTGYGSITPYAIVGSLGTGAVNTTAGAFTGLYTNALGSPYWGTKNVLNRYDYMTPFWVGGAVVFDMLDPLTFGFDMAYGSVTGAGATMDRSGWYLAGKIAYKTPWVTPTLVGWWTSGDDSNIYNGSERMPSIDANFVGTTFGFNGGDGLGRANLVLANANGFDSTAAGTWGIALQLNDISFIDDLTHQIIVAYIAGTNSTKSMRDYRSAGATSWSPYYNNPSNIYLTTADHAWEIDINHKYQIYENLAVFCEMGMLDVSRSKSAWAVPENRTNSGVYDSDVIQLYKTSTAWKLTFGLQYTF
jgi:hypothetical protein